MAYACTQIACKKLLAWQDVCIAYAAILKIDCPGNRIFKEVTAAGRWYYCP
jgi:hypothetical protein